MKLNIKEKMVVVSVISTKNDKFKILKLGAEDFSGTIDFLVNIDEIELNFKERSLVEIEFSIVTNTRKIDGKYQEIITSKRLNSVKKVAQ